MSNKSYVVWVLLLGACAEDPDGGLQENEGGLPLSSSSSSTEHSASSSDGIEEEQAGDKSIVTSASDSLQPTITRGGSSQVGPGEIAAAAAPLSKGNKNNSPGVTAGSPIVSFGYPKLPKALESSEGVPRDGKGKKETGAACGKLEKEEKEKEKEKQDKPAVVAPLLKEKRAKQEPEEKTDVSASQQEALQTLQGGEKGKDGKTSVAAAISRGFGKLKDFTRSRSRSRSADQRPERSGSEDLSEEQKSDKSSSSASSPVIVPLEQQDGSEDSKKRQKAGGGDFEEKEQVGDSGKNKGGAERASGKGDSGKNKGGAEKEKQKGGKGKNKGGAEKARGKGDSGKNKGGAEEGKEKVG